MKKEVVQSDHDAMSTKSTRQKVNEKIKTEKNDTLILLQSTNMSILSRLKNKLHDPVYNETKLREFDECMNILKNENIELHKRIDQLEALCKTNLNNPPSIDYLQEQIDKLEQENDRLFAENQYQRQEYERFLDQLTTMVVRTAFMQENIRKECATIYHVIERLANGRANAVQMKFPFDVIKEAKRRILNTSSSKNANEIDQSDSAASSNSSIITHCSVSTSDSWTVDLGNQQVKSSEKISPVFQRSETFIVAKQSSETVNVPSTPIGSSRLPTRCTNSNSMNNNRSSSTQKVSSVPVRTTTSLNRQATPAKKSYIPTPIRIRSSPVTTINQSPRTTIDIVISNGPIEDIKSTSSESSTEEQQQQQQLDKLLPIVQDEGYSTWSSIDVKDDVIKNGIEKNDRFNNNGLVKNWLDETSNTECLNQPVKKVEINQLEDLSNSSSFFSPYVRNHRSNACPTSSISFSTKDISLDSLDGTPSKQQTITSSSSSSSTSSSSSSSPTFSRSETFEKLFIKQTLSNITNNLSDSTSSTSSTFNMSEYIEDHFIEHDDHLSENSSSHETTILNRTLSSKPQKRLLFPGLLNRLIFFRRVLSESDLQRNNFFVDENENENQPHVYHSNIINEHSVEVNLINTYGSDSELHVWSHDCAEQRRFLDERQQQLTSQMIDNYQSNSNQELAIERQILLQQIYEYPWLLQENDLERTTHQPFISSSPSDLIVPLQNPHFYQLCAVTNSDSLTMSCDPHTGRTTSATHEPSPIL